MKIATFNANSIRARLDIVVDWLASHEPDILCIQETKVQDHEFPFLAFSEVGYRVICRGEKSYNGVAVISREKPKKVVFGMDDGKFPDEARFAYAQFGSVHVVNTYVPQGRDIENEMYAYKLDWFRRLRAWFSNNLSVRSKVVWVGDLNVARTAQDIHNAEQQVNHVCFHEDVRRVFEETLEWGFVDIHRKHHPEPGQYTFFDYRSPNAAKLGLGWRIDYILATPPLARRSTDAYVDLEPRMKEKPSDHTFLVAEFDI